MIEFETKIELYNAYSHEKISEPIPISNYLTPLNTVKVYWIPKN